MGKGEQFVDGVGKILFHPSRAPTTSQLSYHVFFPGLHRREGHTPLTQMAHTSTTGRGGTWNGHGGGGDSDWTPSTFKDGLASVPRQVRNLLILPWFLSSFANLKLPCRGPRPVVFGGVFLVRHDRTACHLPHRHSPNDLTKRYRNSCIWFRRTSST